MKTSRLLTAIGYVKAPKTTALLRHPVRTASAWIAYRAAKKAAPKRMKSVLVAASAVAATAVAVPLAARALTTHDDG